MADTVKCAVCGEEIDLSDKPEKLAQWFKNNPDKAKCDKCFGKAVKSGAKPTASKKEVEKKEAFQAKKRGNITAQDLRKAYDEVKAEFNDILDEVKEFIGGWTTTIALSNK
ncbi:MAG: hypothetical protein NC218_08490 [Acetobacter sp.]|nr:hypothetical protein [Acetobacter sp.]